MNSVWLSAVLLVVLMGSGLGVVYTKHQTRQLFVNLQTEQDRRDALEIEWRQLQLEHSTLATAAQVDQAARKRLDMAIPSPDAVIYIIR
ncbi:MAG: cell division protein FtsL [Candidatus Competibacteraceae bacterium]|jgi:cell division protein FtsL|nr:cell division protein FtsL [Candidatus Competibacteraceae bacterium]